mgnify:CR=1 FL=1
MIQKKTITEAEALRKLGDLCARGEHCSGEMADKLRKWGIPTDAQERIIDKLIDYKYIDDERFTRSFVRDKITFNSGDGEKLSKPYGKNAYPPVFRNQY